MYADFNSHTLVEMRTDVNAVPHAGLGNHFLRVQVKRPEKKWRSIKFNMASKSTVKEPSNDRLTE